MHNKRRLLKTLLNRAYRLSSCWSYFSDECDRLKALFDQLKYPLNLVNTILRSFVASKFEDPSTPAPIEPNSSNSSAL